MDDFKIDEDLPGLYSTTATVTAKTEQCLESGIAAYLVRFHAFAYNVKVVRRVCETAGKHTALILRSSTCD